MRVRIPPHWHEYDVGEVRTTHVLPAAREAGAWRGGNIQAVHMPGMDGAGMLAVTLGGWRSFLLPIEGGGYAGGTLVEGVPTALVARMTDAGCVLEVRDAGACQ